MKSLNPHDMPATEAASHWLVVAIIALITVFAVPLQAAELDYRRPQSVYPRFSVELDLPVSLDRANALSIEAGGRGLLYSLNYDRSITSNLALGAGFGYIGGYTDDIALNVSIFPVYLNLYLTQGHHRPFLTGGMTIFHLEGELGGTTFEDKFEAAGTFSVPMVGLGYEFRGPVLVRVGPYVIITPLTAVPWAGFTLGATF